MHHECINFGKDHIAPVILSVAVGRDALNGSAFCCAL